MGFDTGVDGANIFPDTIQTNEARLGDDDKLFFGTDDDISLRYDPAESRQFIIRDERNSVDLIKMTADVVAGGNIRFDNSSEFDNTVFFDGGFTVRASTTAAFGTGTAQFTPQDVRNISGPVQGDTAYHDGSGANTEGPAHYNGTDWISTVDGTTIS